MRFKSTTYKSISSGIFTSLLAWPQSNQRSIFILEGLVKKTWERSYKYSDQTMANPSRCVCGEHWEHQRVVWELWLFVNCRHLWIIWWTFINILSVVDWTGEFGIKDSVFIGDLKTENWIHWVSKQHYLPPMISQVPGPKPFWAFCTLDDDKNALTYRWHCPPQNGLQIFKINSWAGAMLPMSTSGNLAWSNIKG